MFNKNKATIYDATTTEVKTTKPPVLTAPRCNDMGLWKLPLDTQQPTDNLNALFDLPSTRQTLFWYHTAAGFPTKETFLNAVQAGNVDGHPKSPRASPPKLTRLGLELGLARSTRKSRSTSPMCVSQTGKTVSRTITQNGIDLTSKRTGIDQTSKRVTWIDQTIE